MASETWKFFGFCDMIYIAYYIYNLIMTAMIINMYLIELYDIRRLWPLTESSFRIE